MRKLACLAVAAGLGVAALTADSRPGEALIVYQWCAHYNGRNAAPSCGSTTYAQCMATLSGNGGFCAENPWWTGPQANRRAPRRKPQG
jgi:hypothetical protein